MDVLHKTLVSTVRSLCADRGVVLTSLPDLAGVARSHFWEVLAGRASPTLKWLGRVAEALEVPVSELLAKKSGSKDEPLFLVMGKAKHEAHLPLYSLEAAASAFSAAQTPELVARVRVRSDHKESERLFVGKVRGHSMEPTIPAGAFCLFRLPPVPSPFGKVVLVELRETADPEHGGRYTVKRLKMGRGDKVILMPDNSDYEPLFPPKHGSVGIVAELLEVLEGVSATKKSL